MRNRVFRRMQRVRGHPSPCPSPTRGEGTLLPSLGSKALSPCGRGLGEGEPRKDSRKAWRISVIATVAALFAWGWFGATLNAPAPTPILLDRDGGFMAQLAAPDDAGYGYWAIADLPPRV